MPTHRYSVIIRSATTQRVKTASMVLSAAAVASLSYVRVPINVSSAKTGDDILSKKAPCEWISWSIRTHLKPGAFWLFVAKFCTCLGCLPFNFVADFHTRSLTRCAVELEMPSVAEWCGSRQFAISVREDLPSGLEKLRWIFGLALRVRAHLTV